MNLRSAGPRVTELVVTLWVCRSKIGFRLWLGVLTVQGRCCVVAWWAGLGAAGLSSDGEGEFDESFRDPVARIDVGGEFVVAAVKVLD